NCGGWRKAGVEAASRGANADPASGLAPASRLSRRPGTQRLSCVASTWHVARRTWHVARLWSVMKSVADEFDVFDSGAQRFVDVASVLASNARLTDLLQVLQRERDQLDLLLDVTNAVVTQLDTRELFRAVAPALRRCCSADVAALSVYDPEAGVLRHHVCDAPDDFRTASDVPMPGESTI